MPLRFPVDEKMISRYIETMRLTDYEIASIKGCIQAVDPDARIYLFGSRVDDSKKGGDIDLIVLSENINGDQRRKIKINLYDRIGEQKIDLIVTPKAVTAFHRLALAEGVLL